MRSFFISLLLSVFFGCFLFGQELVPVFENITEGLPSTEVHDMFQDSIGYMWFATDRGISRYDGERFTVIDTKPFFSSLAVYKFFVENQRKVWVLTGDNQLYWFNPLGKYEDFNGFAKNEKLEILKNSLIGKGNISNAKFVGNDIYLSFRNRVGLVKVNENGYELVSNNVKRLRDFGKNPNLEVIKNNGVYYCELRLSEDEVDSDSLSLRVMGREIRISRDGNVFRHQDFGVSDYLYTEMGDYFAISDMLFRYHRGMLTYKKLPGRILCLLQHKNQLLVGTFKGAVKCDRNLQIRNRFLLETIVTSMLADRDNNVWLTTYNEGVFISKNLDSKQLKYKSPFDASDAYMRSNGLILFDKVRHEAIIFDDSGENLGRFGNIFFMKNRIKSETSEFVKSFSKTGTTSSYEFYPNLIWDKFQYRYFINKNGDTPFYAEMGKVFKVVNNNEIHSFYAPKGSALVTFCFKKSNKELILGSENGLLTLDIDKRKVVGGLLKGTESTRFYNHLKMGNLILMSSSRGLQYFKSGDVHAVGNQNFNDVKMMVKQNDSIAWTFNDRKIFRIKITNGKPNIDEYKISLGRLNPFIISLAILKNDLWVVTKTGVFISQIKSYHNQEPKSTFSFVLDSVLNNSNIEKSIEQANIYKGSNVNFFFSVISYDRRISRNIEYSINGKTWFETNKNSVILSNLDAGEYKLKFRRVDSPSTVLLEIPFSVKLRFYQTFWFRLFMFFLIGFALVLFVRRIYHFREKRREEELEKVNIELKLLTSRMNPHFTFNTINSIQYYIMKSDKKEAITYLADFALLIRKSLDFTMNERISIKLEKEFLELYIKMENKRFSSNFLLDFQTTSNISRMTKNIPSMLIQPLVENVIIHADYPEDEEKIIRVHISYDRGYFVIQVVDFGQGIRPSVQIKDHKSYGLEIIKSRVKIYNGKGYRDEDVKMFVSDTQRKIGTTVEIKLKEWT